MMPWPIYCNTYQSYWTQSIAAGRGSFGEEYNANVLRQLHALQRMTSRLVRPRNRWHAGGLSRI